MLTFYLDNTYDSWSSQYDNMNVIVFSSLKLNRTYLKQTKHKNITLMYKKVHKISKSQELSRQKLKINYPSTVLNKSGRHTLFYRYVDKNVCSSVPSF